MRLGKKYVCFIKFHVIINQKFILPEANDNYYKDTFSNIMQSGLEKHTEKSVPILFI